MLIGVEKLDITLHRWGYFITLQKVLAKLCLALWLYIHNIVWYNALPHIRPSFYCECLTIMVIIFFTNWRMIQKWFSVEIDNIWTPKIFFRTKMRESKCRAACTICERVGCQFAANIQVMTPYVRTSNCQVLDSLCAKSLSAIQDPECPTSCTEMHHWSPHLLPAMATCRETHTICSVTSSIAPFATEMSRWERKMSLASKQKRNTKRKAGFRQIYTQSHVKWVAI